MSHLADSVDSAPSADAPKAARSQWKSQTAPPPPTNCVVLKNLDYNITQASLEEVVRRVTGGRKEFVNIALIDDKATGSFRGMAFINFHSTEDATAALQELSKMVINNRKVFAEYRRLRPGEREKKDQHEKRNKKYSHFTDNRQTFEKDVASQDTDVQGKSFDKRAAFFAKRDTVKKVDEQKRCDERAERDKERESEFRKRLVDYSNTQVQDGEPIEDIVFETSLTSYERRMVHTISSSLGLGHISRFDDDGNRVLYVTKDPERKVEWEKETAALKATQRKEEQEQKRKKKENGEARNAEWKKVEPTTAAAASKDELQGIKWFKPRAASTNGMSAASGIRPPSYKMYIPPRQPTGPDGTIGFSTRSRGSSRSRDSSSQDFDTGVEDANGCDSSGDSVGMDGTSLDGVIVEKMSANETKRTSPKKKSAGRSSSQSALDPSVPAFSPSYPSFS